MKRLLLSGVLLLCPIYAMAIDAPPQPTILYHIHLKETLSPQIREDKYEDPLHEYLQSHRMGRIVGSGTRFADNGEPMGIDIEAELNQSENNIGNLVYLLQQLGAPANTEIEFEQDHQTLRVDMTGHMLKTPVQTPQLKPKVMPRLNTQTIISKPPVPSVEPAKQIQPVTLTTTVPSAVPASKPAQPAQAQISHPASLPFGDLSATSTALSESVKSSTTTTTHEMTAESSKTAPIEQSASSDDLDALLPSASLNISKPVKPTAESKDNKAEMTVLNPQNQPFGTLTPVPSTAQNQKILTASDVSAITAQQSKPVVMASTPTPQSKKVESYKEFHDIFSSSPATASEVHVSKTVNPVNEQVKAVTQPQVIQSTLDSKPSDPSTGPSSSVMKPSDAQKGKKHQEYHDIFSGP